MTDTASLFHNPERFTDQELKAMRYKLKKQRLVAPASFLFGVASGFAVDSTVFNSRYFGRRVYLAALPGFAFAAIGGYIAYDLDQAVDCVKDR